MSGEVSTPTTRKRIDIKLSCTGIGWDGIEISGTLTARVDISKAPWPDQKWDGSPDGDNPFKIFDSGAPISIIEVISTKVLDE